VVVLGLSLSAVLTMIITPPLLALFLGCGPKKLVLSLTDDLRRRPIPV